MTVSIDWLPGTAYLFLVVFARVGSMIMLVPVFGEAFLNTRVRAGHRVGAVPGALSNCLSGAAGRPRRNHGGDRGDVP